MGCCLSPKLEELNKCECKDFKNCNCKDCNNLECDCNLESKLITCQNCDNEMLYKDFIQHYGFCNTCRTYSNLP